MTKTAAILLLTILGFNLIGYKLLFDYLQNTNDELVQLALDKNNFNDSDLITLKIPISLPYITDYKDFERVDGEVTINGIFYRYVKRKVENGELILMCLPDRKKMELMSGKEAFFKLANDIEQYSPSKQSNHKSTTIFKLVVYDYKEQHILLLGTTYVKPEYVTHYKYCLPIPFLSPADRPPSVWVA
ncbi:MAG: hypothetical protein NVS9B7_28110 [Flavisolibacter sp.]